VKQKLVDGLAFAKAHLDLGGVDIDVHAGRIHRQEQRIHRVAVVMQHIAVGLTQRVLGGLVTHKAAIHIKILRVAAGLGIGGRADKAAQRHAAGSGFHRDGFGNEILAQQRCHPCLHVLRRQAPDHLAIVAQHEFHLRMRQRNALERGLAVGVFGVFTLEEFAPRRGVEVQVHHFHAGAGGVRGWLHRMQCAVDGDDLVGVLLSAGGW
jgi:hypothetical protein